MDMCTDPNFLRILMLVQKIVDILKIAAALILVIMGMIAIAKTIIDDKPDLTKSLNKLKNMIIVAVAVILLPTFIDWVFFTDNFITANLGEFSTCINNMNETSIQELEAAKNESG